MEAICFTSELDFNKNLRVVRSLQTICRNTILKNVTLKKIQQVADLPLPPIVREYLCTFHIPTDFDFDGIYEEYNFNFPNHFHHKTHQIHPAKYVISGENVLLKYQSSEDCSMCKSRGLLTTTVNEKTREKWACLKHDNLMQCHLRLYDRETKSSFHVLDFPIINLEDLVIRAFIERKQITEQMIWDVLRKLTSVLLYLAENDIHPWELCHPRHVVVRGNGDIMLENMLLYLPSKSGAPFQIETCARLSNYSSPEQLKGQALSSKTLIWGLGCILSELAALIPSSLQNVEQFQMILPQFAKPRSYTIRNTIEMCLRENPCNRPTLKQLERMANLQLFRSRGKITPNIFTLFSVF